MSHVYSLIEKLYGVNFYEIRLSTVRLNPMGVASFAEKDADGLQSQSLNWTCGLFLLITNSHATLEPHGWGHKLIRKCYWDHGFLYRKSFCVAPCWSLKRTHLNTLQLSSSQFEATAMLFLCYNVRDDNLAFQPLDQIRAQRKHDSGHKRGLWAFLNGLWSEVRAPSAQVVY